LFVYALKVLTALFVHIFVNSVERLNSPVYSAPPCGADDEVRCARAARWLRCCSKGQATADLRDGMSSYGRLYPGTHDAARLSSALPVMSARFLGQSRFYPSWL